MGARVRAARASYHHRLIATSGAAVALLAAAICASALAHGAASPAGQLLVVSAKPSYLRVARSYDGTGHLLSTVVAATVRTSFSWSPDGTLLAVTDSNGVSVELPDGTGKRRLLAVRTLCTDICRVTPTVTWSPDGRQLAIGGVDPKTTGLVIVNVASGRTRPLIRPHSRVLYAPIGFSPDGKLLAYGVDDESGTRCACESLVLANADGSQPHTLVRFHDHHDGPGSATWSPDSTRIAFTEDGRDPRDPHLGIVNVRTGSLESLDAKVVPNANNVFDQSPTWSPDGASLAIAQYHAPAFTIGGDGAGFQPLPAHTTQLTWLGNGDLLFPTGSTLSRIAILHPNQKTAATLLLLPHRERLLSLQQAR